MMDWNDRAARALGLAHNEQSGAWLWPSGEWHSRPPNYHDDPLALPVLLAAIAERGWELTVEMYKGGMFGAFVVGREIAAETLQAAVCEAFVEACEGGVSNGTQS
mgnify:CR=1 FL=1